MKKNTTFKLYLFSGFLLLSTLSLLAQQGKYEVIKSNYSKEDFPYKKNKKGKATYDSRVFGNPKFYPGYLITLSGEKIEGNIALFTNNSDWNFIKRSMLIIPKGENKAHYLGKSSAIIIYQKKKKEEVYYDYYNGEYLERLVSGKLRLSYNPEANTSKKISSFVATSQIGNEIVKKSIEKDLNDGKNLEESLEKANLKSDAIGAISSIEITEKEYLVYDISTEKTILITKSNYKDVVTKILSNCGYFDDKEIKKYSRAYNKIVKIFNLYNNHCK